jgi:hypothetical protein
MTWLFRFLILGPLILVFGLIGLPCVWVSVRLMELNEKLKEEP